MSGVRSVAAPVRLRSGSTILLFGLVLLAAAVLAGCASAPARDSGGMQGRSGRVGSSAAPHSGTLADLAALTRAVPCTRPSHRARAARPRIAALHPVAAVLCVEKERRYPGHGEWTVQIRQATKYGMASLVRALDRPDLPQPKRRACPDILIVAPPVALIDSAGRYRYPRFPLDQCGQPQLQARNAVDNLPWQVLAVHRLRQQLTQEEVTSHCAPQWKNELYLDTQFGADRSLGGPVFTDHPDSLLHACLYRTAATPDVGIFLRAVSLDSAQSNRLRAALSRGGPTGPCPTQHQFAVIGTMSGDSVTVELGGCWRVQRDQAHVTVGGANASVIRDLLSEH